MRQMRHDVFADDAFRGRVIERAFQAVTDLDAQLAIVFGNNQQHTVINALAADFPLLDHAHRVFLDGFRLHGRHHQYGNLDALLFFKGGETLLKLYDLLRRQRAGQIGDP